MKPNLKRIFALAAACILCVSAMSGLVVSAETEPAYAYTDAYVLTYEGSPDLPEAYQSYCKPYLYISPHNTSMNIRNLETGRMEGWTCRQKVYNLIDTSLLDQGGEGPYASLEVYCVDACINANGGAAYRRINLEDATYFDATTAGRLRAVFMNSFPYVKDMTVITNAVNGYMESLDAEFTPVSDLTAAEVVTAAQYTIWQIANGADVKGKDHYYGTESYTPEDLADEVIHITDAYMDCTEGKRDTTDNNIALVQKFLQELAPMAPQKTVVSENVLTVGAVTKEKQEDGTYTMTIPYQVNAEISTEDELTLSVTCGDVRRNVSLHAENLTGQIELTGVNNEDEVTLEVNGYQMGGDVYLYDASENRDSSQSMIGYDRSRLPVHAKQTLSTADHILQIYKTTGKEEGKIPLANIAFDVYLVATIEDIASGSVRVGEAPTAEELEQYLRQENHVTTLTTDSAGFASFNFTENGYPDGIYLITEQPNAAVTMPISPFYVAIPGTSADGSATENIVKVYPKNSTETGPLVSKDVTEIDNDHDTFDVNETHTWIIRGTIPAGMANALRYEISDTLDYRLTYGGNVRIKVGLATDAAHAEAVVLEPETHYTLTETEGEDEAGNRVDTFRVALTEAGRKAVAAAVTTGSVKDYEVRVYFDAVIDSDAQLGVNIPNTARLDYTNTLGVSYEDLSDEPEVHTGGTAVLKKNSQDESALAGAVFKIARDATEEELADETVIKETIHVDGQEHTVVYAAFYPTADMSGEKCSEVTTGQDGVALLYGLAYGEYYLVETKAPAGFNLLDAPIKVQIDETAHEDAHILTVYNSKFTLPDTGGVGTTVFTATGIAIVAVGAVLLLTGRKKKAS